MTTKLEQAARQALEALEFLSKNTHFSEYATITALREALSQDIDCPCDSECIKCSPRVLLAEQAEQEPVVKFLEDNLVVESERVDKFGHRVLEIREEELLRIIELYAAPVRTKDLTDDEIEKIGANYFDEWSFGFARAVIAADREKNK